MTIESPPYYVTPVHENIELLMKAQSKVLILRTVSSKMTSPEKSYSDVEAHSIKWPKKGGTIQCKDWDPSPVCGHGFHGLKWGVGEASLLSSDPASKWLVIEAFEKDVVDLGNKCKFKKGKILFCGKKEAAVEYLQKRAPNGVLVVYGNAIAGYGGNAIAGDYGKATAGNNGSATAGDYGTAIAGDRGTATAGYAGHATAGDWSSATAGYRGSATAGNGGTAIAGYRGKAVAGDEGQATAGDDGTATVGNYGKATAGDYGTATAGVEGLLTLSYYDTRIRIVNAYVGEKGILPNVAYKLNEKHEFVAV
jgi:hypothetical protein